MVLKRTGIKNPGRLRQVLSNKRKWEGKGRGEEEAGFCAKLSKLETRVNLQKNH